MSARALAAGIFVLLAGGPVPFETRPTAALAQDGAGELTKLQVLAFNDFHGQLTAGPSYRGRPLGGAAVLAAHLRDSEAAFAGPSLIVHAGDHVGASPPESALLQDEPSISFLNLLGNRYCRAEARQDPRCNVVGTLGNHEFDEGTGELLRLLRGGRSKTGPFLERPYRGAHFPYVSANVVRNAGGTPLLPPYTIRQLSGLKVAVIGAVTRHTPELVAQGGVRELRFLDEAEAINRAVREVRRRGVQAIVVSIHQGGEQVPYEGPTRSDVEPPSGPIREIVAGLDDAVDLVISGHAHAFTNARLPNAKGRPILVTQAFAKGTAFARIELAIDRATGDVVEASASILPTYADTPPGTTPAADVAELVKQAELAVSQRTARPVGHAQVDLAAHADAAGESALGDLVADAQRSAVSAQVAFMNLGGMRSDLHQGPVTWGELFEIQPFGNTIISMDLTGAQILRLLAQQWHSTPTRMLQVSGLRYQWDPELPPESRVHSVEIAGAPLNPRASYRVAVNNFLADGSGGFPVFLEGKRRRTGPLDIDALVHFIETQGGIVAAPVTGRIRHGKAVPAVHSGLP